MYHHKASVAHYFLLGILAAAFLIGTSIIGAFVAYFLLPPNIIRNLVTGACFLFGLIGLVCLLQVACAFFLGSSPEVQITDSLFVYKFPSGFGSKTYEYKISEIRALRKLPVNSEEDGEDRYQLELNDGNLAIIPFTLDLPLSEIGKELSCRGVLVELKGSSDSSAPKKDE